MSAAPALLAGLGDRKGQIAEGFDADLVVWDPDIEFIVDPKHRGRGIGRRLLEATLAVLKERGARRAVLSTADRNERAQHLFASMGFRRTMIEMTRELDA